MSDNNIALIAGLGNPGNRYTETRHNVGFWFIERMQSTYSISFRQENKFKAETGHFTFDNRAVRVIAPETFMNLSGQSVAPMASFYRIEPAQILVVHDELDLQPGTIKLKVGGGHGGHNGLRDIASRLGSTNFIRLRIGIGHPGDSKRVSGYVLKRPTLTEQKLIEHSIDRAIEHLPDILSGDYQKVMNQLHTPNQSKEIDNGN